MLAVPEMGLQGLYIGKTPCWLLCLDLHPTHPCLETPPPAGCPHCVCVYIHRTHLVTEPLWVHTGVSAERVCAHTTVCMCMCFVQIVCAQDFV